MLRSLAYVIISIIGSSGLMAEGVPTISVSDLHSRVVLLGKLHVPMGAMTTIEGIVREGPRKGFDGGFRLQVQRINGLATQEHIGIKLTPLPLRDWGDDKRHGEDGLARLEEGFTYRLRGYESGSYVGTPIEVFREGEEIFQTAGFGFLEEFVVTKGMPITPIIYTPADYVGREVLTEGIAVSDKSTAVLMGPNWKLIVDSTQVWPADVEGREVAARGVCAQTETENTFTLVNGTWHLVELADQLGHEVVLRGRAKSLNGIWWFDYRGTKLYVENLKNLPGWRVENHWRTIQISGHLTQEKLPDLDRIGSDADRNLKIYFLIKLAKWEPINDLLGPEQVDVP